MASRVGNYVGVKLNGYEKNSEQKCKWLQILCSRRHGTICFEIAATPHIWQWQVLWTFQYMIPLCFVFLLWSHIKRIPRHKQLKSGTERIKNKWIKVKDILLNVWFREIIESIRIIHYYKLQILTHCEFEWIIPEHMLFVAFGSFSWEEGEQKQCVDVWVNCIAFPTRKNHNKCEL